MSLQRGNAGTAREGSLPTEAGKEQGMVSTPGGGGPRFRVPATALESWIAGERPPAEIVSQLLHAWIGDGSIESGAFYVRGDGAWECAATSEVDHEEAAVEVRRLLAWPSVGPRGASTTARREGRFVAFSLGTPRDELARLIVTTNDEVSSFDEPTRLPRDLHVALSLMARELRARRRPASLQGHLSRRLHGVTESAHGTSREECDAAWRRDFPEITGRSAQMAAALDTVRRAARQDVTVMIHGESGVGKELIARAVHRLSTRARGPFVSENCAAFPESLFEAEVFGSEKGAYTGADAARPGLLERATGGTLFLDEIAETGHAMQSKLLRVLQEREVRRVGGARSIPVDFRLITATHRDLEEEVRRDRFRQDLFFRVQVVTIRVPALRERREDIPLLARDFVRRIAARRAIAAPMIEDDAMEVLCEYDWPGNIRELQNEMECAVTLSPERITADVLSGRFSRHFLTYSVSQRVREELGTDLPGLEKMVLGGVIRDVLEETGGNKTRAARILGIPKASLYRRLVKYGITA